MRITDERYARDFGRLNLAMRLIALDARTHTICTWTGLTPKRVRTLSRSYHSEQSLARHRGPTPIQQDFFLRSPRIRREAAALGGILQAVEVIPVEQHGLRGDQRMEWAERLCRIYEIYRDRVPDTLITVDHAFLLAASLSRPTEIELIHCRECGGGVLIDRLGSARTLCVSCRDREHVVAAQEPEPTPPSEESFVQGSLF